MNLPAGYEIDAPQRADQFTRVNSASSAPTPPPGYEIDAPVDAGGALEAGARGALRNFPFAQQAAAAIAPINPFSEKKTYSEEIKHLTDSAEASKAAHKVAYGTGAVAATAAPLLIPGAGAALEAAPILGNAAMSVIGSQSDTDLTAPTRENAKDAAIYGVIGGGIGALFNGAKNVLPLPTAEDVMAENTASGVGATARKLLGSGMMGKNPQADLAEMGNWLNTADEGKSLIHLTDKPGEILSKVQGVHDKAGAQIGALIDRIAPGNPIPHASITKDLYPIANELGTRIEGQQSNVMEVINEIKNLANNGELDISALNKIKSQVGKVSKDNPTMQRVYGALSDSVNNVVDEFGRIIKDPSVRGSFDKARVDYKNASRLIPILRYAEAKDLAGGAVGNSGLLGMFGLGAGVAAGHPVIGAAAMAANSVGRPIVNQLGKNIALKSVPYIPAAAEAAGKMSTAAQLELANALESKFKKKE